MVDADVLSLSPARLARVLALLDGWAAAGDIPGWGAVCRPARGVAVQCGFGRVVRLGRPEAGPQPAQADTIFLIASPSKPVTATAVLLLVERGLLLLDDPVSHYIPEFKGEDRQGVKVRHLLTHTSGLPDMLPENVPLRQRHAPLSAFVQATCCTPLLFAPGTDCRYQSMGILLLGEIAQRVSGFPLPEFLRRELFQPLGMADTCLGLGDLPQERIARLTLSAEDEAQDWTWNKPYWRDLGAPWGGLQTTVGDYARFLQMFLDGGRPLLSRGTVEAMLTNQTALLPGLSPATKLEQSWGLGWRLNQPRGAFTLPELGSGRTFGHLGSTGTVVWADPETGMLSVLFTTQPKACSRFLGLATNAIAATVG